MKMNCRQIIKPIKTKEKIFFVSLFLLLFSFLLFSKEVQAATVTWDGSASTDWATAANWDTNSVPLSTDDVIINGSYTNAPTLDLNSGSVTVNSLSLGSSAASTLTISNGTSTPTAKKLIVTANATIGANGALTHTANSSSQTHSLVMDVGGDMTVTSGGSINVNGKGYGGGGGNSNGSGPGGGIFFICNSNGYGFGGSYGGSGGYAYSTNCGYVLPAYGSSIAPVDLGSGGGGDGGGGGGSGGGAIKLNVTGVLTVSGSITANGANGGGSVYGSGGGSGGSVFLIAGTLTGTGSTTANGGNGSNSSGGGGSGGRIAIYYTTDSSSLTKQAVGGTVGYQAGGAGTITFTKATLTWTGSVSTDWATANNWNTNWNANRVPLSTDDVIINGSYTNAPTLDLNSGSVTVNSLSLGSSAASTLTISNGTSTPTAKKLIVTANATIGANGALTHTANSSSQTHSLVVDVGGDMTVDSGGSINVNGKGYGGGH